MTQVYLCALLVLAVVLAGWVGERAARDDVTVVRFVPAGECRYTAQVDGVTWYLTDQACLAALRSAKP